VAYPISLWYKRAAIMKTEEAQNYLVAFNDVCSYNCTRNLVQKHINEWEMPKENEDGSSQSVGKGGLAPYQ
jgi:hypothetical protein